jgi:hypothetical protein
MTVIVPYVAGMLHEQTEAWAKARGRDTELVELDRANDAAYWILLSSHWRNPRYSNEDLLIVEQDMLPADGVVDEMLACRWGWCSSPYEVANRQQITDGLGVTKFSAALKALRPQFMIEVGAIADDGLPAHDWRRLDTRISRVLRAAGHTPHIHAASTHLHDYQARP